MNIKIKDAYENNLKHINLTIPKNKLIVFTGLSGSGKSTLAMETLQRECQRQYMESLGLLLDIGSKPKVGSIEGLSPAISISQQSTNRNPRSTAGTVTELTPYLRVLFAKLGERDCPHCGKVISQCPNEESADLFTELPDGEDDNEGVYEQKTCCPHCGNSVLELTAGHFSFNKPQGACPSCKGVGQVTMPDINRLLDRNKSLREFAVQGWDQAYIDRYCASLENAAKHYGFQLNTYAPVCEFNETSMDLLLYGVMGGPFMQRYPGVAPPKTVPGGRFEGIVTNLMRRYEEKSSHSAKQRLEKFLIRQECPVCHGVRFRSEILSVRVSGVTITEALSMSMEEMNRWLQRVPLNLSPQLLEISSQVIEDLRRRIDHIIHVGAGYLCLNQPAGSLSAGEIQRIKLASILGSGLTGVVYVLDEPTAGLHARDTQNIVRILRKLRDMGNTVIVIEHDMELIRAADHIVDFGPGAGKHGGRVVAVGTADDIAACKESVTGRYLKGGVKKQRIRKAGTVHNSIHISHASTGNLKDLELNIPLCRLVAVSGVSGAGKTSLVFGVLERAADAYFHEPAKQRNQNVTGFEHLDGVISISQTSIMRSPRSNAATYTDVFSDIRHVFATLAAKQGAGIDARDFSYNVPGGRCEKCQGAGRLSVPMHFLSDVEVICPACRGRRYKKPVLAVTYHGHSIADLLDLSIDEAIILLQEEKAIVAKLKILHEVGLGYLGLGQAVSTLSGGEAQRLKLAKELSKRSGGKYLYLFDEPTTGLHPRDVSRLVGVFDRLVMEGNSVIVVEHNPIVISASDWVIDLGPDGGNRGGEILVSGTPEEVAGHPASETGRILRRMSEEEHRPFQM